MIRSAWLIVALWAIITAPVLCTAGVLAHECQCSDGEVCEHEADCEVDPCSEQILRRDGPQDGSAGDSDYDALVQVPTFATIVARSDSFDRARSGPPDPTPPLGVPHASDLPLLI